MNIANIVSSQREYFNSGITKSYEYRQEALTKLKKVIIENEQAINAALFADLGKSDFEGYMTEIGMVLTEITFAQKHLKSWMRKKHALTPLAQFYASSFMVAQPYGLVLVMSPWNYPFMLTLDPIVGAICAGNCVTVKPSAYAPKTSAVIAKIIAQAFDPLYVSVIEGGRAENTALLEERFDFIFFTGSVEVGKLVMEKASKNLTPVVLELGGKSPCIIEKTANLKLAARRVAFGKYLNAGQTCVAPDYLLIDRTVKTEFLRYLKIALNDFFGPEPLLCQNYGHIVNEHHFNRLCNLIKSDGKVFYGGNSNEHLQIEPTVICDVTLESPVMQEEIFGPILPVIEFEYISDAIKIITEMPKPLALYLFTTDKKIENRFLTETSFGGGCINDTIIHLATSQMPFGGVGNSGMGSYHGKFSFETFSHRASIVKKANFMDLPIRYQPYTSKKFSLLRLFMK